VVAPSDFDAGEQAVVDASVVAVCRLELAATLGRREDEGADTWSAKRKPDHAVEEVPSESH
jgi:hypothetical protein